MTTVSTYVTDAIEFGQHIRAGGWRLGLLVARNVEKGDKGGSKRPAASKVSAQEFARVAKTSAPRVLRFLEAWELAAKDGHVPRASSLKPSQEVNKLDVDTLPDWQHYYQQVVSAKPTGGRPRASVSEVAANIPKVVGAMSTEQKAAVIREAAKDTAAVTQAMSTPHVRRPFEDTADRQARARRVQSEQEYTQRRPGTPLAQKFWQLTDGLRKVAQEITDIAKDFNTLAPTQYQGVDDELAIVEKAVKDARAQMAVLMGTAPGNGKPGDIVVEGHDVQARRELNPPSSEAA